ncbi:hypothetical protein [Sporosarcina sp. NPDC096371]|uniref:hypothetical protein n=1 Tax=Sporosarcina sp. NPDC096371 TaxID=3364530 RepID=UPI0038147DAA
MGNDNFDKRMEFLKTSYDRIPSSFDPDEVLQKIEEETNKSGKKEPSSKKKGSLRRTITAWGVGVASVLLFGIITALFVADHNEKLAGAEYVEKLQKGYAVEREKKRDVLKLEEDKFGKLAFVEDADTIIEKIADDKEQAKADYERARSTLALPSDMMKNIADQSLVEDEQASLAYLDSFFGKVSSLIGVYDEILVENKQAIEDYEMDPTADKAKVMMLSPDTFPKELQNIIDTMEEQYIELTMDWNTGKISPHFYAPRLADKVKSNFHPDTRAYVTLALARTGQPGGIDHDGLAEIASQTITLPNRDFEQQVKSLYEQFKTSHDKTVFKGYSLIYFAGVFNYANDMDDPETMYYLTQSDEIVVGLNDYTLEGYVANWRKGRSLFKDTEQIVFSAESVTQSGTSLSASVQMIRNDGTSEDFIFLWGYKQNWELFMGWLKPLPSTDRTPETPIDEEFMASVLLEYELYTKANYQYDLYEVDATVIVGLYFYAGEIGDYETQYSLYVQGEFGPPVDKETFIKEAALSPSIKFDEMYTSISFKANEQQGEDGNWSGLATLTLHPEHDPNNSKTQYFSMTQTGSSWRVNYLPMQ